MVIPDNYLVFLALYICFSLYNWPNFSRSYIVYFCFMILLSVTCLLSALLFYFCFMILLSVTCLLSGFLHIQDVYSCLVFCHNVGFWKNINFLYILIVTFSYFYPQFLQKPSVIKIQIIFTRIFYIDFKRNYFCILFSYIVKCYMSYIWVGS